MVLWYLSLIIKIQTKKGSLNFNFFEIMKMIN